ncbi:MAG: FeoB-associated Cys-rich membrane protein [Eubacteriales bacterium]|nr:FeoB-associated Cys-rich membrane protein [Eubacteriales bacterium]
MTDLILITVLILIVALAGGYVYRAKKSDKKCIGCPDGCSCNGGCNCEHSEK